MRSNIIERLFASFSDLEQAIENAKSTLAANGASSDEIIERLGSYDGILGKQRSLAHKLCEHVDNNNWDEVARHVNLINGLSAMIRDDARAILSSITQPAANEIDSETKIC